MKRAVAVLVVLLAVVPAFAEKACEELKSEIAAKIDAKGVKGYQLDVVAADQVKDQKVVGTCESGKKRITYQKGAGSPAPASPKSGADSKKPAPVAKKPA